MKRPEGPRTSLRRRFTVLKKKRTGLRDLICFSASDSPAAMMRIWILGCFVRSALSQSHPVELCSLNRDFCAYNSYSGFADVGTGALFYWYFEPKVSKVSGDVPLILWLQGGPGSTSMLGNFFEHGPVALNSQGQLLPRAANETWAAYAPVLYVDSPVGTGWSWARDQGFAKSQSDVARALARFLDIFAAQHTHGSRRLVLAGESYGGHYVPSLGNYLLQNPGPFQLDAVMVGDGLTDPAVQVLTKPQEAYAFGLVDETKLKEAQSLAQEAHDLALRAEWLEAAAKRSAMEDVVKHASEINPYDVRTTEQYGWQQERMQKFFENKSNSQDLLHIPENLTFGTSPQVEENLKADIMKSQKPHVESLLNAGVRVLLYQGQFDWRLNTSSPAFGTFVLVVSVGLAVASPTPSPWAPLTIATVLTVMVYATYNISGAQLNPAVTFALTLLGKKTWSKMVGNWIFQFMGAFMAASVYKMICALENGDLVLGCAPHLAVVAPVPPFHVGYSLGAEALYTGLLVFVVLNCAARPSKEPNQCFGLAIGFAFLGSGYACGHISGAALNPAVALPLGLGGGKDAQWAFCWFGAELVGAGLATGLYWLLRRSELQVAAEVAAAPAAQAAVEGDTGAAAPGTLEGPSTLMRCLAEAIGTFMLMVTVGLNIVSGSRATAYSAAAMVMCMIYAVGDISGGHFNPAVTLAVVLGGRGKITKAMAAKYVLAQLAAAALAGVVYAVYHMGSAVADKSIKLVPGHGYSVFQAALAELVATMVLSYTVLSVATVEGYVKDVAGLVVAYALTAGSFAAGSVSGGEVNPAVVLGLVLGNVVHPGKSGMGPAMSWIDFWPPREVRPTVVRVLGRLRGRIFLPHHTSPGIPAQGIQERREGIAGCRRRRCGSTVRLDALKSAVKSWGRPLWFQFQLFRAQSSHFLAPSGTHSVCANKKGVCRGVGDLQRMEVHTTPQPKFEFPAQIVPGPFPGIRSLPAPRSEAYLAVRLRLAHAPEQRSGLNLFSHDQYQQVCGEDGFLQ
eukprot:s29_g51.t1